MVIGEEKRLIKHDRYLQVLYERLESNYDSLSTNLVLYSKRKNRKVAEIDLIAYREDTCDVFEVKCSYRVVKAKKQLKKIKKLMPEVKRTFFYCGESDVIENIV